MARWPTTLGVVGGLWGLSVALLLALLVVFLLPLGDPSVPTQILILTTVIGSLSGFAGGALTRVSMTAGGAVLVAGASLALLGWSLQEKSTRVQAPSLAAMLETVFFVGWIAFVLGGGLFALFGELIRPHRKTLSRR